MVFGGALALVAKGIGFGAPKPEAGAFVQALSVWSGATDAETEGGDARQRAGVLDGSVQQSSANALAAVSGEDVHAPKMDLVRGFDVVVAVKAERAHQIRAECADDDRIGRTVLQAFADCIGRASGIVLRRRHE